MLEIAAGVIFAVVAVVLYSALVVSSRCSREEERRDNDYNQR